MIVSHFPGGKGGGTPINEMFLCTGSNLPIDDGDGNWRIKFLSSGTFVPQRDVYVDIFAVGGGGNGGNAAEPNGGGGGGGGYTKTVRNQKLEKGKTYTVTVGAAQGTSSLSNDTGIVICEAKGGNNGSTEKGGNGGSGGGAGAYNSNAAGTPGTDGSDGKNATANNIGGEGQGTTTREFGEADGDLYAGGGGGGSNGSKGVGTPGAEGGGGDGGGSGNGGNATAGGENTGGGGGGGSTYINCTAGSAGGSGIVIIRNARVAVA